MKRGSIIPDYLIPWLIAIGVLLLLLVAIAMFSSYFPKVSDFISNLRRFGG